MNITTNIGTNPADGKPGLPEGSTLTVNVDKWCIFITMVLLDSDAKIVKNRMIGTPDIINQADYTHSESIKLKRWFWNLKGPHTIKVVAWGVDNEQSELDAPFEIY